MSPHRVVDQRKLLTSKMKAKGEDINFEPLQDQSKKGGISHRSETRRREQKRETVKRETVKREKQKEREKISNYSEDIELRSRSQKVVALFCCISLWLYIDLGVQTLQVFVNLEVT